jgi:transcriptional regulator NrdR family protein
MGMKTRLRVIKADGSVEEYFHTKVVGTINNALARTGQPDMSLAEELAEVVTYFLYDRQDRRVVTSSEILSIVKAVLSATNYEEAAIALSEYHFKRQLKRSRTEVVSIDIEQLADAERLCKTEQWNGRCRWDKSKIANDLVAKHSLSQQTARTIASMVEEKVFSMGLTLVSASLVKQLVLGDTAAVLRAQHQLQTV